MSTFIDTGSIWFRQPIICAADGLEALGYREGNCPVAERVGLEIINLPCVFPEDYDVKVLNFLREIVSNEF